MRLPALLLPATLLVLAGLAGAACSAAQPATSAGPDEGNDTPTTAPTRTTTTATSDTCLGKVGLDFEKPACNTCMSADGCCQATIACFSNNADCSSLQTCMAACGGGGSGTGGGTGGGDGGTTTTSVAQGIFVTEVYPAVSGTCGGCHGQTGPGPQFFGTTADLTYPMFKIAGFDKANSSFVLKGAHQGPALTAAQKTTITKWVNAELAGAGTGGGGGGGGTGGGTGGGSGAGTGDAGTGTGANKVACQTACKAKYPAAVEKWTAYNTCVSTTCGASCL